MTWEASDHKMVKSLLSDLVQAVYSLVDAVQRCVAVIDAQRQDERDK